MTTLPKSLPNILFAFAGCAALALSNASADQNHGRDHGNPGMNDEHLFEIELSMMPTPDAPPNSSARLSFEAENEDGIQSAGLKIKTDNLPAGNYSVGATLKSD